MKTIINISLVMAFSLLFSLESSAQKPPTQVVFGDLDAHSLTYPIDIITIIDNKCYGCHSPEGKNDKAKKKLMWKNLQTMEAIDLVGTLGEITEVLQEGAMPPKKIVEKYPNMKLTDTEVAALKAWVDGVQKKLMDE